MDTGNFFTSIPKTGHSILKIDKAFQDEIYRVWDPLMKNSYIRELAYYKLVFIFINQEFYKLILIARVGYLYIYIYIYIYI